MHRDHICLGVLMEYTVKCLGFRIKGKGSLTCNIKHGEPPGKEHGNLNGKDIFLLPRLGVLGLPGSGALVQRLFEVLELWGSSFWG